MDQKSLQTFKSLLEYNKILTIVSMQNISMPASDILIFINAVKQSAILSLNYSENWEIRSKHLLELNESISST